MQCNSLQGKEAALYPVVSLLMKICAQRKAGSNLVPRVLSYLSLSRSVGTGRTEPWERGWVGRRKRARFRLSSFLCSFALCHQSLACHSRFALASPRKTRRLRRRQRKKCSEPFLLVLTTFFSISGKFFWTTDSSLQSSGCKNLNHWAVHGVRNRIITSCLIAQLILAS